MQTIIDARWPLFGHAQYTNRPGRRPVDRLDSFTHVVQRGLAAKASSGRITKGAGIRWVMPVKPTQ